MTQAASLITDAEPRCGFPFPVGTCELREGVAGHLCARPPHHADGLTDERCRCACGTMTRAKPSRWCPGCDNLLCEQCYDGTPIAELAEAVPA